jgi:azurin
MMKYIFAGVFLVFLLVTPALGQQSIADKEAAYFKISSVPIPEGIVLEVGGLAFDDQGILGVTTRRGEFWRIENPQSAQPRFTRFAQGLHEPLGLAFRNGAYFLAQRGELTKIIDTNGDGKGDQFDRIYDWDLAGNYHEYAYGPKFLPNGDMVISLNLGWIGRGASLSKWSGWMLQISQDGKMMPLATGMRSPAGFNFNKEGDLFYTENQGDWVGSGRMTHIEKGVFAGHPEGLKWSSEPGSPLTLRMEDIKDDEETTLFDYAKKVPALRPPSVWFPHTLMGISTSDIAIIPDAWTPFAGQLLVGDQGHSKIMRVYQEKIDGVYQGICFPFKEGFSSGLLRMEWGPDQTLYVGMTSRGWAATGKAPFGLQRLNWTGKVPFEMEKVEIQSDGFLITFTEEIDKRTGANPESYAITDFNFKYHHLYGSPPVLQEDRTIYKVELGKDGRSVKLFIEGLRPGFVNEIKADGVKSTKGTSLLHPVGYYTINKIPSDNSTSSTDHSGHKMTGADYKEKPSDKRITEMPATWTSGPDLTIEIKAIPGMLFDKKVLTAKPGQKIKLVFNNPDDMAHNFLLVNPGMADKVGDLAMKLGLKGEEMGFIPESEEIIAHTALLRPNSADVIYFEAPKKTGNYQYVCTFPAHAATMRGILMIKN